MDPALAEPGGDTVPPQGDLLERSVIGQEGDDNPGAGGSLASTLCYFSAALHQWNRLGGGAVPDLHPVTLVEQPACGT